MQKTVEIPESLNYITSNPLASLYLVNEGIVFIRFTYRSGSKLELFDYTTETANDLPLSILQSDLTWKPGDILYTFAGIKEFLDKEPVLTP